MGRARAIAADAGAAGAQSDANTMTESMSEGKSAKQLRDQLGSILDRVDSLLAPSPRALRFLFLYCRLRAPLYKCRLRGKLLLFALLLAFWLSYRYTSTYYETVRYQRCLIEQPSWARQVFRPVEDCSICWDVRDVEKISGIDPKLFEERYAYSGRPVVINDATVNWTAMELFSFAYLKELYQGQEADCQFFPYKTEFQNLQDVFNMSVSRALLKAGTKPWYVGWSNCDETIGAILRKHYQRPYFLPDTAESEKTDWIFMGSPGYGAPMHVDDVEYPSWQAQIRGQKRWILEPPRECHYSCQRVEVTLNPGEIIVLDTNKWYHQTMIVSEDISITIGAEYD